MVLHGELTLGWLRSLRKLVKLSLKEANGLIDFPRTIADFSCKLYSIQFALHGHNVWLIPREQTAVFLEADNDLQTNAENDFFTFSFPPFEAFTVNIAL